MPYGYKVDTLADRLRRARDRFRHDYSALCHEREFRVVYVVRLSNGHVHTERLEGLLLQQIANAFRPYHDNVPFLLSIRQPDQVFNQFSAH